MRLRKKRPSLEDAHRFHREGVFTVDEYVSHEELLQYAYSTGMLLNETAKANIPRTKNLEYMVLKCHIITEFAITKYIQFFSPPVIDEAYVKLNYVQKLDIAHMMGLAYTDPCIIPSLELLNRARNQVAHKLNFEIAIIDELVRINSEDYHEKAALENRDRLRGVRYFTVDFCAYVSGTIVAHAHLDKLGPHRQRKQR